MPWRLWVQPSWGGECHVMPALNGTGLALVGSARMWKAVHLFGGMRELHFREAVQGGLRSLLPLLPCCQVLSAFCPF